MPQMAPMNWLILFLMFSLYILMFSSMNYFFFNKTPLIKTFKIKNMMLNWLW